MNKIAIKNFAIWARNKLIADIVYQAGLLGVTQNGIANALPQSNQEVQFFDIGTKDYMTIHGNAIRQRDAFVAAIKAKQADTDYASAFRFVVEKIAYTWFNRLIAIRFMEVNDYLPGRVRVLSSENPGKAEPDMVTRPFDTDLSFSTKEQDEIIRMKDENKLDELFRMLFIKQCQKMHEVLPNLFEEGGIQRADSYLELLLTISFTDKDGVLWHLIHDISEDDFNVEKEGQVEIIGWMYQYYNTEPKDQVFANLKKNIKISKDSIPAATQLFTPDWIVRYMVENSLGRLWLEAHPNEELKKTWKYYLEEAEQEPQVKVQLEEIHKQYAILRPEEIKVIDPCMGSGHILIYLFDVLMQIYESQGWTQREAAQSIVKNNLFGIDIDDRAAQLAYFAVMMKARQYDRRFLERGITPHVVGIQESNTINRDQIVLFGKGMSTLEKNNAVNQLYRMLDLMFDANEYGSILEVPEYDWDLLYRFVDQIDETEQITLDSIGADETSHRIKALITQARFLSQQYDTVITNPPYLGSGQMGIKLLDYVRSMYPDSKADLFGPVIEKAINICKPLGYIAMITQQTWMFLPSFDALRNKILLGELVNLLQLGARAFDEIGGEVVQTAAFIRRKSNTICYNGIYLRLVAGRNEMEKQNQFFDRDFCYIANQSSFSKLPGTPIAYWADKYLLDSFIYPSMNEFCAPRVGCQTSDNNRFLRLWFEVDYHNIGFDASSEEDADRMMVKWFPFNKGGNYRKWYGNRDYVVNWKNKGFEVKDYARSMYGNDTRTVKNQPYYFRKCFSWSKIFSGYASFRYYETGFIFSDAGLGVFTEDETLLRYIGGFLNSFVSQDLIKLLSPTLNLTSGIIEKMPLIIKDPQTTMHVATLVDRCIQLEKEDFNETEISWNFSSNFLRNSQYVEDACALYIHQSEERKKELLQIENQINQIFLKMYGANENREVLSEDITVNVHTSNSFVKMLVSYAVGCMFGRYSLDVEGLVYSGGPWNTNQYLSYQPDADNCIPITDEAYFEDDIVGRFVEFIKVVYGAETLEDNLTFISKALDTKGDSSRTIIRNYFLNDFFKDHCATYSVSGSGKRPIYWLFDSGKYNGFKALVYMHRWNADTVGNLRVEYLHRMQRIYEKEIERMQDIINNSKDNREINQASKRHEKLVKQLKETRDYDAKIAHIALSRLEIDLDDGVKANYEKVQKGPDGKSLGILAKI